MKLALKDLGNIGNVVAALGPGSICGIGSDAFACALLAIRLYPDWRV
jgi:hypothetical protein